MDLGRQPTPPRAADPVIRRLDRWIRVVRPSPPCGADRVRRMLMRASDRRVHRQRSIDQPPLRVRLRGERRQHLVPGALDSHPVMPGPHRLPRPERLGKITPRDHAPIAVDDPSNHQPRIRELPARTSRRLRGGHPSINVSLQQRRDRREVSSRDCPFTPKARGCRCWWHPRASSRIAGRSGGAHMTLLEKSLLPGVVFAGYVARPSRRSRRILRPSRKKTNVNTARPLAGIATARSRPACALTGTILPVECPHRLLSGGDVSRSSAHGPNSAGTAHRPGTGRRCPDDPAVVAERTSTLFADRRQQELDERLLGVGQVLGT